MKITKEHYAYIKNELSKLDYASVIDHKEKILANNNYKDLNTRIAYDCSRAAGLLAFTCEVLYKYVDDSHVKTALIKASKELNYI